MLLLLVSSLFLISCDKDDSDTSGSLPGIIEIEFQGEWVRNDLTNTDCEQAYDVDGGGTTVNESQGAYMTLTSSNANYFWQMYLDDGDCAYSTSAKYFRDTLLQDVEIIAYTANDTTTIKATVGGLQRLVSSDTSSGSTATVLNSYNTSAGACGKTNWFDGDIVNLSSLTCGVVGGSEEGMDDFKFSSMSVGDVMYWRFTISGSNLLIESSTDNVTYSAANTYYKK